jgi:hypothetical protein
MSGNAKRLKKARRTRTLIAQTFSALDNDQLTVTDVLRDPPRCLRKIRIYDVLRRIPHLNRDGAEKVLQLAKVWPLQTLGSLSPGERQRIISHLPPRVRR